MAWLGVRCWKDRIALLVVEDKKDPCVLFSRRQTAPIRSDNHGLHLEWYFRVVNEAIDEASPDGVAIRVSNSEPGQVRAECEGVVAVAAATHGLPTRALRQQSMWKPLGLADRKSDTWKTFMAEDPFISSLVGEEKEAAMVSLAAARRD